MERIFRGLIQIGSQPDPETAVSNWKTVSEANIDFPSQEDSSIYGYLNEWYEKYNEPPHISIIKTYFEKDDNILVVSRLDEISSAQFYSHSNYKSIVIDLVQKLQAKAAHKIASNFVNIFTKGMSFEKGKFMKGSNQAIQYFLEETNKLDISELENGLFEDSTDVKIEEYIPVSTGINCLDEVIKGGFPKDKGKLIVVGGRPGAGKSTLAANLAYNYINLGHPVLIFSLDENSSEYVDKINAQGEVLYKYKFQKKYGSYHQILNSVKAFLRMPPPERLKEEPGHGLNIAIALTAKKIKENTKEAKKTPLIIIDSAHAAKGASDEEDIVYFDRLIAMLKKIKNEYNCWVVLLGEVSKASYRNDNGVGNVSGLSAFKGSSAPEFGADLLIFLTSRGKNENKKILLRIEKSRMGGCGIEMGFRINTVTRKFEHTELDTIEDIVEEKVYKAIQSGKKFESINSLVKYICENLDYKSVGKLNSVIKEMRDDGRISGGIQGIPFRIDSDLLTNVEMDAII